MSTGTFSDHTGQRSWGRLAATWVLGGMVLIALFGLVLVAWMVPINRLSAVADLTIKIIGAGTTVLGIVYASAQVSKAASHIGDGLAGKVRAAANAAATPTASAKPPQAPPMADSVAAKDAKAAAAKATVAT